MRTKRYITLEPSEIETLSEGFKNVTHHQFKNRCHCLLLSNKGYDMATLKDIFQVSHPTITNWFDSWQEQGLVGLRNKSGQGRTFILAESDRPLIKAKVQESPQQLKQVREELKGVLNKKFWVVIRQVLMTSMIQQGDLVLRCLTSQTLTPHWIMLVKIQQCPHCQSSNIVKNGHTRHQNQRVKCHDCGKTRVLMPKRKPLDWSAMERSLRERLSLRGIARVFRVSLETVLLLVKVTTQRLPACRESILPAHSQDIIEFDELWSYVQNKQQDRWLWTAICRRTRQIIAWAIGDHSQCTFKRLLRKMPHEYRRCVSYSDAWRAYNLLVNSSARHEKVGKESGQTNHMERWNNTLRQRISRYVRKALSFSKTDMFHQLTTKLFIWHYNLERINTF